MTSNMKMKVLFVLAAAVLLGIRPSAAQKAPSLSLGINYTYVHSNLLPGCNCFGLHGGGAELQYRFSSHLALIGEVTATHGSSIANGNYDLTQVTYSGGMRYFSPRHLLGLRPFGDLLLGGAHASGSLAPDRMGLGGANAFSLQTGGGVDIRLGQRWTLVPVRATYLLTTFSNGRDNYQNDLRLSTGIRMRLGGR